MSVRVLDTRLRGALVGTRLPFRFGIVEMTELVHVVLFATVEVDGVREVGVAADNLAPKWFTKDPDTSYREDAAEMVAVIEDACAAAVACGPCPTVFDLWHAAYRAAVVESETARPPLLSGFGVSLIERVTIDAFCRVKGLPFAQAVRRNELGVRLEALHPELAGRAPSELLPARPSTRIRVRHTVGLADTLVESELAADPDDGLPATLEACIRRYGLRRFKVKIGADSKANLDRLERIGSVLTRETGGSFRVTLDGNEQLADVEELRELWESLVADRRTAALAGRIDYVEQPLPRHLALGGDTAAGLAAWPGRPRLLIDESDDALDSVARALTAGYDGGAFKSSKGVFKGIGNACRLEQLRRERPGRTFLYSAEDLSTIGPVGLPADLAAIATLGIDEPERNGYHYLRGLSGLPARVEAETVRRHPDLFTHHPDGRAVLRIAGGQIALDSVAAAPFGVGWRCDFEDDLPGAASVVAALRSGTTGRRNQVENGTRRRLRDDG
ncbi:MAG: hypothetical protein U0R69_03425 [Gaiellales bacterium]